MRIESTFPRLLAKDLRWTWIQTYNCREFPEIQMDQRHRVDLYNYFVELRTFIIFNPIRT